MADTTNKYNFLDYEGLSLFWNNVKNIIDTDKIETNNAITNLDTRVDTVEGALANQIISITYTELKTLRDSGQFVPGQQYRITDYTCTTTQTNTRSAGHAFDIIVTADDESTLNEVARAIQHTGDSYFVDCDLNVWNIWYCLDNDTTRFAWADNTNGKGVIYRMIDEFNNDVPYDFKNIQFARDWSTIAPDSGLSGTIYCYTFSVFLNGFSDGATADDESIKAKECMKSDDTGIFGNNIIGTYQNKGVYSLNNIVFVTDWNGRDVNHYANTFGSNCHDNTVESTCYYNTFGNNCYGNTLRDVCIRNSFGNDCNNNTFGSDCFNNTFGSDCFNNTFGNGCNNNTLGNNCSSNSFGSNCESNSFGNNCWDNSFRVSADASSSLKDYVYCNHFDGGCSNNVMWNSDTTSSTVLLKNINVNRGVVGKSSSFNMININTLNQDYEIQVAKNSKGEIKIYCEADLIA